MIEIASLTMAPDGSVKGTFRFKSPMNDTESEGNFEGQVAGKKLRVEGRVKMGNFEPEFVIEGEIEGATMKGSVTIKRRNGERVNSFKAERKPKSSLRADTRQHDVRVAILARLTHDPLLWRLPAPGPTFAAHRSPGGTASPRSG